MFERVKNHGKRFPISKKKRAGVCIVIPQLKPPSNTINDISEVKQESEETRLWKNYFNKKFGHVFQRLGRSKNHEVYILFNSPLIPVQQKGEGCQFTYKLRFELNITIDHRGTNHKTRQAHKRSICSSGIDHRKKRWLGKASDGCQTHEFPCIQTQISDAKPYRTTGLSSPNNCFQTTTEAEISEITSSESVTRQETDSTAATKKPPDKRKIEHPQNKPRDPQNRPVSTKQRSSKDGYEESQFSNPSNRSSRRNKKHTQFFGSPL